MVALGHCGQKQNKNAYQQSNSKLPKNLRLIFLLQKRQVLFCLFLFALQKIFQLSVLLFVAAAKNKTADMVNIRTVT